MKERTPDRKLHPQTESITRGYDPMLSEGSVTPPVFRTSTFVFRKCKEGKRAFELAWGKSQPRKKEVPALIYSRVNNPNTNIAEDRLVVWDGAEKAALFASGMGAVSNACLSVLKPGDEILYADPVYGGTEHFFLSILPAWGVKCHAFPAGASEAEIAAAAKPLKNLRLIYLETCSNPTMVLTDIGVCRRVADACSAASGRALAKDRPVLVFVDNTFMGPVFCHPLKLGADLVIYSVTKFIGGHSDLIAGAVLGSGALVNAMIGARTIFGSVPDPETAWLITRSLGTVELRMEKQAESARQVAKFLRGHKKVARVLFPGEESMGKPQLDVYRKMCSGPGSVLSFEVKGGEKEAFAALDALQVAKLAVSLGGIESLAQHPYTMTHSEMPELLKAKTGITPSMIRYSVGLEHPDDLIADLDQALGRMGG